METFWAALSPQLYPISQLLLASVLGAVIGWQRETHGKAAGARTCALVTGGAALFTILSAAFPAEPSHVAAQIVVGIGFLGAGLIIQREDRIVGLTTAASLWFAAAIGMAVGFGFFLLAIIAAALTLLILTINEEKLVKPNGNEPRT